MSSIQIGRCVLDCPAEIVLDGDRLRVSGELRVGRNVATARRQQLLALARNIDEPAVPVLSALDPDLDGFYRVLGAAVEPVAGRAYRTVDDPDEGTFRWSVDLERLSSNWSRPLIEVATVAQLLANDHAVTAPTGRVALAASHVDQIGGVDLSDLTSGSVFFQPYAGLQGGQWELFTSATEGNTSGVARYIAKPDVHYLAPSCEFDFLKDGVWYPLHGRHVPYSIDGWRIHNGYVALLADDVGGVDTLGIGAYDSVADDFARHELVLGTVAAGSFNENLPSELEFGGAAYNDAEGPFILRNSPDAVVVRITRKDYQFTFTVRRGAFHIAMHELAGPGKDAYGVGVKPPNLIGSAVAGGVQSDSTVGASSPAFKLMLLSANDVDVASGAGTTMGIEPAPAVNSTVFAFAMARDVAAGVDSAPDTMLPLFLANTQYTERIVLR